MSYDGAPERAAIRARVGELVGGRVYSSIPASAALETRPYIVLKFGIPILAARDRSIRAGEKNQPYILPITAVVIGSSVEIVEPVISALLERLIDFEPTSSSAGIKVAGNGYTYVTLDATRAPIKYEQSLPMDCRINLGA